MSEKLSALTVRRLTKLADHMAGLPRKAKFHFDMGTYFSHEGGSRLHPKAKDGRGLTTEDLFDCGTSACALGFAAALPEFRRAGLALVINNQANICYKRYIRDEAAMSFFHLTMKQTNYLFGPVSSVTTPKQWAIRCRSFLKRNGVIRRGYDA